MIEYDVNQLRRMRNDLAFKCPEFYDQCVETGDIIEEDRQSELSKMSEAQFKDYLMNRKTSERLSIYPEYVSDVMNAFSEEIFDGLSRLKEITLNNLPELREQLGSKAKMIELEEFCGKLYTRRQRKKESAMSSGELEFRVREAVPVCGSNFFFTTTGGYYGFLKFYNEEIGKIAPDKANAYLLGNTWCVNISKGRTESPIIAGEYRDVALKDDTYHVVPIKFFDAEMNRMIRYTKKMKCKGKDPNSLVVNVVPRMFSFLF